MGWTAREPRAILPRMDGSEETTESTRKLQSAASNLNEISQRLRTLTERFQFA